MAPIQIFISLSAWFPQPLYCVLSALEPMYFPGSQFCTCCRGNCSGKSKCPYFFFFFLFSANKLLPYPLLALFWNLNIKTPSSGKKKERWWYGYTNDNFADRGENYQRKISCSILMKGHVRVMKIISREKVIPLKPVSLEIKYLSCLTNTHFIIKASYCEDWREAEYNT